MVRTSALQAKYFMSIFVACAMLLIYGCKKSENKPEVFREHYQLYFEMKVDGKVWAQKMKSSSYSNHYYQFHCANEKNSESIYFNIYDSSHNLQQGDYVPTPILDQKSGIYIELDKGKEIYIAYAGNFRVEEAEMNPYWKLKAKFDLQLKDENNKEIKIEEGRIYWKKELYRNGEMVSEQLGYLR